MSGPRQIIFCSDGEVYHGALGKSEERVRVRGVGGPLPAGMFGVYTVVRPFDGVTEVHGRKQARSKHARREFYYRGDDAVNKAQAELLKWATRILRERSKEA